MENFEIIVDDKNLTKLQFGEATDCLLSKICINQVQPASAGKKLHFYCTYDAFYCDVDDVDGHNPKQTREKVEISQFVIGSGNNSNNIEFYMNQKMNPVFSVEGPGSLKVSGRFLYNQTSDELDDDIEENEENDEQEQIEGSEPIPDVNQEKTDETKKSDENEKTEVTENIPTNEEKIETNEEIF